MGDIPESLRWACLICVTTVTGSAEDIAAHLEGHGHEVERWPDGKVAVDMSDAPELM